MDKDKDITGKQPRKEEAEEGRKAGNRQRRKKEIEIEKKIGK